MTIQEILEAHQLGTPHVTGMVEIPGCLGCSWEVNSPEDDKVTAHRAHVAEVLEQHMQEWEARAWSAGFHKGRKTENGSHISTWPKNPYRKDTSNGR